MLHEIKEIINNIDQFLEKNESFNTVHLENDTVIQVFSDGNEPIIYHGYELYLIKKVAEKLNCTLDFKFIKDENAVERFLITTDANFNLESYIRRTNKELTNITHSNDEITTVYLSQKISESSHSDFNILTGYSNGSWVRYDLNKAELLYAAVFQLPITMNENGVFLYDDLVQLNNMLFDEIEQLK